ncbi:MAG TPA: hypothetical protein VIF12_03070, partial [Micavibrio sp.]
MAQQDKTKSYELKGDFAGVVLRKSENGALTVDLSTLGNADVTVINCVRPLWVKSRVLEQDTATAMEKIYSIGDVLPDGWIVGPVSPDTGLVMAIEPAAKAPVGYKTWYEGQDHANALRREGHTLARQPLVDELKALYNQVVKAGCN